MAVMAKWQSKTFEISTNKVNPLKNFATSTTMKSESSKSKKGKTELVPISFDVDIHANVGTDPKEEYESWCSFIQKTDTLYLNGRRWGRESQLKEVSLSGVLLDDFGRIRFATIGLKFEEVNQQETKESAGSRVTATEAKKEEKKPTKRKGEKVTIAVGSNVKLTGTVYISGKKIFDNEKNRVLQVGKISGNQAYIPQVDEWVSISTLSLVS